MAYSYSDLVKEGQEGTVREQTEEEITNGLPSGYEVLRKTASYVPEDVPGRGDYSTGDASHMNEEDWNTLQDYKAQWQAAYEAGDQAAMDLAHEAAQKLRYQYGYSGGADGSEYKNIVADVSSLQNGDGTNGQTGITGGGSQQSREDQLKSLLDQWKQAAIDQQNGQIDYAVAQAVTELERALEDAQPKFKEQAEAVAKDEMQGLDNSALYAEARGDKGGIGQSQYNEIQAAAAKNRLAVQQEQTKLATDTARQIADLRAQGEFEKADAALEIAQSYLSQLIGLEQWAAEFGLSEAQFQESIRQWEAEYNLAMQQFQVDTDLSYAQLTGKLSDGTLTLNGKSQLADMGEALLSAGIMPNADQLEAMGMTEAQAGQYLTLAQLEAEQKKASGQTGNKTVYKTDDDTGSIPALGTDAWYQYVIDEADKAGQNIEDYLRSNKKTLDLTESNVTNYAKKADEWQNKDAMQTDYFRASMIALAQQLEAGQADAALATIEARWGNMSPYQKKEIEKLLNRYGYSYMED